jgi:hypothetical protein
VLLAVDINLDIDLGYILLFKIKVRRKAHMTFRVLR